MNIVVVQGRVRAEPDRRVANDGSTIVSFDLVIDTAPAHQVPVTWRGSPSQEPAGIEEDQLLTVVGSVDRRFYRRAGATVSRTDVRAERVVRGAGKRAAAAIAAACGALAAD